MNKGWLAVLVVVIAALSQGCDLFGWTDSDGSYVGQLTAPTNTTTPPVTPLPPPSVPPSPIG